MTLSRRGFGPARAAVCALLAIIAAAPACTVRDGELGRQRRRGQDGGPVTCGLTSPVVQVQGRPTCAGRLASAYLSNALCSCANVQVADALSTRGFDARQGPPPDFGADDGGASVGINGNFIPLAGSASIGGTVAVAGTADLMLTGNLAVRGDLWAAGNVVAVGAVSVTRDAWFARSYVGIGPLTVGGTTHHAERVVAVPFTTGADELRAVVVPPPCACGPDDLLDVGSIVDAGRLDNDNLSLGLSPDAFAVVVGAASWTLPCGRAYLRGIGGVGSLAVHVTGKSVVFIDGSIDLTGAVLFELAPGAEVDVFVKGDVQVRGALALAGQDRPAAGRLWVGGSQPITLFSPWVGNLYAPRARVLAHVGLETWGSIFAADFATDFVAAFTFDRSISDAGSSCGADSSPAIACRRCGVCSGGTACVAGACGACVTDADCCGLSVCTSGRCGPLLDAR